MSAAPADAGGSTFLNDVHLLALGTLAWTSPRVRGCVPRARCQSPAPGETMHHGSLASSVGENNRELDVNDPARKYKGRTVFLGDTRARPELGGRRISGHLCRVCDDRGGP